MCFSRFVEVLIGGRHALECGGLAPLSFSIRPISKSKAVPSHRTPEWARLPGRPAPSLKRSLFAFALFLVLSLSLPVALLLPFPLSLPVALFLLFPRLCLLPGVRPGLDPATAGSPPVVGPVDQLWVGAAVGAPAVQPAAAIVCPAAPSATWLAPRRAVAGSPCLAAVAERFDSPLAWARC